MLRSPLTQRALQLTRRLRHPLPALYTSQRYAWRVEDGKRIFTGDHATIIPKLDQERTLYEFMMKRLAAAPDVNKVALVQAETGDQLTFKQIIGVTEKIAEMLYHVGGVRRGDVVCLASLNTIYYAPIVYAILRLGAIVSAVNPVADADGLAYHFRANEAKLILGMKFFQQPLEGALQQLKKEGRQVQLAYIDTFLKPSEEKIPPIPADYDGLKDATPHDTVYIPFSSGTSGMPKGVQLTNRNIIAQALQLDEVKFLSEKDIGIGVLPFFHIYGFVCGLNTVLAVYGQQFVMMKYSLEKYVELMLQHKTTLNLVAPPIMVSLVKNKHLFKDKDTSFLRALNSGAAPLDAELQKAVEKVFPSAVVVQGYGMTEMSPVISVPNLDRNFKRVYGSVGSVLPDTEVRIVKVDEDQQSGADKSRGEDCADGEEGEIWTRGPQLMKGYLKQEDTEATMQDGWYRTGDIGLITKESSEVLITDRLKELIKYKGFQVSPAQLEGVVLQHPWVMDCIVIGVPDPREASFEVPRALVVLKPDLPTASAVRASDEIYRFVMARCPPQKRLHGGVRIVESIPKNAAGKLLRRQARQNEAEFVKREMEEIYNGEEPPKPE